MKPNKDGKKVEHSAFPDRLLTGNTVLSSAYDIQQIMRMQVAKVLYEKQEGNKILDLGCSGGVFLQYYLELARSPSTRNPFYVGVDFDSTYLEKFAAIKYNWSTSVQEKVHLELGDVSKSKTFKKLFSEYGKFNVCLAFEVIEHFDEELSVQFLKNIHRILEDDGVLLLSTPIHYNPDEPLHYPEEHFFEFMHDDLVQALSKAGFVVKNEIGNHLDAHHLKRYIRENDPEAWALYKRFAGKHLHGSWLNSMFALLYPEATKNIILVCVKE